MGSKQASGRFTATTVIIIINTYAFFFGFAQGEFLSICIWGCWGTNRDDK